MCSIVNFGLLVKIVHKIGAVFDYFQWGELNIVTPRRSKYECAEHDNVAMLRRGGLPLFIGPCRVRLIVLCVVRSVIDSRVCGANCDYYSYVSVRKYK